MAYEDVMMIDVDSSNVRSYGYDAEEMVFYVTFFDPKGVKPDVTYWYAGVDPSMEEMFLMSDSKGSFVWKYLRGQYEYGQL